MLTTNYGHTTSFRMAPARSRGSTPLSRQQGAGSMALQSPPCTRHLLASAPLLETLSSS